MLKVDDWPDATIAFYDAFGGPSSYLVADIHTLTAVTPPTVPGDFNGDAFVNAADYAAWRDGLGTTYTQGDYDLWHANFGRTAASGAAADVTNSANLAVPEPTTLALAAFILFLFALQIHRRNKCAFRSPSFAFAIIAMLLNISIVRPQQPFFMGLGDLSGESFSSWPSNISADGSVVVGWSSASHGTDHFRWTRENGMVGLGILDGYSPNVSADGSTVVGGLSLGPPGPRNVREAYRWTSSSGVATLPLEPGWLCLSGDGSIVAGIAINPTTGIGRTARWTEAGGVEFLPLPTNIDSSTATDAIDITPDGSKIVGRTFSQESGITSIFTWSAAEGYVFLVAKPLRR